MSVASAISSNENINRRMLAEGRKSSDVGKSWSTY